MKNFSELKVGDKFIIPNTWLVYRFISQKIEPEELFSINAIHLESKESWLLGHKFHFPVSDLVYTEDEFPELLEKVK